jgi:hypothetical protein
LFDNGPLVNNPGGGVGGADESMVQSSLGMITFGFGHQVSMNSQVADDFSLDQTSEIDSIVFYAYQIFSTTASTITEVRYQIWNGPPDEPGSSVLFGDLVTNRLLDTGWSGIYRVSETTSGTNTDRPIMKNTVSAGVTLPAGIYWIQWSTNGTLTSGPWAPPITINGSTSTGNGIQFAGGNWQDANDSGTGAQQGFPFLIYGDTPDSDLSVEISIDASFLPVPASGSIAPMTITVSNLTGNVLNSEMYVSLFLPDGRTEPVIATHRVDVEPNETRVLEKEIKIPEKGPAGNYLLRAFWGNGFVFSSSFEFEKSANGRPVTNGGGNQLHDNYPDPFNPSTTIRYLLKQDSHVTLRIYTVLGELVRTLVDGLQGSGEQGIIWDGTNDAGARVGSGMYIYRISTGDFAESKRMLMVK